MSFAFSIPSPVCDVDWLINTSAYDTYSQSSSSISPESTAVSSASSLPDHQQPMLPPAHLPVAQERMDDHQPSQVSPQSPAPSSMPPDPKRLKHRAVDAKRRDRENAALSDLQRLIQLVEEDDQKSAEGRLQTSTFSNKHKWKRFVMEGAARALQHTYQQTRLLKQLLVAEQQQRMQERFTQQQTYVGVVNALQGFSHSPSTLTAAVIFICQLFATHCLPL